MMRGECLEMARKCVCEGREQDYGSPENNFTTIARMWTAYLSSAGYVLPYNLKPHDVAAMMALLKIARIASGQSKPDSWVDLAGYAACGAELQCGGDDGET